MTNGRLVFLRHCSKWTVKSAERMAIFVLLIPPYHVFPSSQLCDLAYGRDTFVSFHRLKIHIEDPVSIARQQQQQRHQQRSKILMNLGLFFKMNFCDLPIPVSYG